MKISIPLKRTGLWVLIALFVLALVYIVAVPRPVTVETALVERKTFREVIKSDGVLRSKDRYTVPAFADGDIKRVDLKVGDPVKKGQVITDLYWDVKYDPVKSPIDGVVSKLFRNTAGPIRRGEPIVEVIDPDRLEAVAELLTPDATRIRPGASARISGWGEEAPLSGNVIRVSKAGFTKQSALGVEEEKTEVTIDLVSAPQEVLSRLGSTFHVDITIEIGSRPDVLVIPVGALFRDGDSWAAYRIQHNRASVAKVVVPARSEGEAVIESGLSEQETVIVYPGDLVKNGARVKIVEK